MIKLRTHPSRQTALELRHFIDAAESLAQKNRKQWSGALRRKVRAAGLKADLTPDQRIAEAVVLVNAAPDLPPLPAVDIEAMLQALEGAASCFGIAPTIALRADLRAAMANKPPPEVAHQRTVDVFSKHLEIQQIRKATQRMASETRH